MYFNFLVKPKISLKKNIIFNKKFNNNLYFFLNNTIFGIILQKNINQITILIIKKNYYVISIYYDIKIILILG